ncbi:MAG: hypothetical protein KGH57_00730 [Candidatus Micrarchaeota archaeon]|nr:hypothetical protein [Candidatus Micrarchaeota archaeon]
MTHEAQSKKQNMLIYIGIAVVVIVLVAVIALNLPPAPTAATTTAANLTTVSVAPITTTIVKNITTATGPNLATCNGYNVSISQPNYEIVGSCNWRGGLMNITLFGGSFQSVTLELVQQNTTLAPHNISTSAGSCAKVSGPVYVYLGNYKVVFRSSTLPEGSCGNATVRMSIS